jgi:hypothetical protein
VAETEAILSPEASADFEANHWCILSHDNNIYLGTSLNTGIKEGNLRHLLLELKSCDEETDGFGACDMAKHAWYDSKRRIIAYSKSGISDMTGTPGFLTTILNRLGLIEIDTVTQQSFQEFLDKHKKMRFKRLYSAYTSDKRITATIELGESVVLDQAIFAGLYEGFTTDLCVFIEGYDQYMGGVPDDIYDDITGSQIRCEKLGNNYHIMASGGIIEVEKIWSDLTGKLLRAR